MAFTGALVRRHLRGGALALTALIAASVFSTTCDARWRRHRAAADSYDPAYSSIVVDANSGAVMQAANADSPRHPASLTKVMTLYLLFEQLEAGKIKLTSEMPVSAHAAVQAPSKLGLKPGSSIDVGTAIRAIVTKSANDVAVIVAEALAGDESEFARRMTAKAHALGMKHTIYRNASGLPDERQITTARDQAILGRAIQDRFPNYYQYFSTKMFAYRGKLMRNHNHLLGRVDGVDGIKTGYIHESGFNIIVSVRRNNRHLVAVMFGGRTAGARDARVRSMIDNNINIAAVQRTAPRMVEGWETAQARPRTTQEAREKVAAAPPAPPAPQRMEPAPGSTDPIKPNPVKTVTLQLGTIHTASLLPLPHESRKVAPPAAAEPPKVAAMAPVPTAPPPPPGAKPGVLGVLPARLASAGNDVPIATGTAEPAARARSGGWMIQVGAFDDENEAKRRLAAARGKAKDQLAEADPFTERVAKGDKSLYRARFAGLDKDRAQAACKNLKRNEIPCMLLKN